MSENLFIPLFMFSLWLLLEFFDTTDNFTGLCLGFVLFCLYFTRITGFIPIITYIFISIVYIIRSRSKNIVSGIKTSLIPIIPLIGLLSLWSIYKFLNPSVFTLSTQGSINPSSYLPTDPTIFFNIDSIMILFTLLTNQIRYILGSVIILPLAGFTSLMVLIFTPHYKVLLSRDKAPSLNNTYRDISSLFYVILFFIICSIGMILPIMLSWFAWAAVNIQNIDSYWIFGRYTDPIIPPIITFGILGIYYILANQEKIKNITQDFIFIVIGLLLLSITYIPIRWGWIYNSLSSWHISTLHTYSPAIAQLFLILSTCIAVAIFLYLGLKRKDILPLIFYFGIIFLFAIGLTVPQMMVGAQQIDKVSEYFQNQTIKNIKIGADQNEIKNRYFIISFWSSNEIIHDVFSSEQIKNNQIFYSSKYDYIISYKQLPLTPIVIDDTYLVKLYSTSLNTSDRYVLTPIIYKSGFSGPEYWASSVHPTRWMTTETTDANLEVYSHGDQIATLTFNAVSFNHARNLNISLEENFVSQLHIPSSDFITISIPLSLKNGANNIQLHTESCDKPSSLPGMYNSDPRCLSIAVQNISFN